MDFEVTFIKLLEKLIDTIKSKNIESSGTGSFEGVELIKGKSAYQIWLEFGNTGTEQDFLNSLKGQAGQNFFISAYDVAVNSGYVGTEKDFWVSLQNKEIKTQGYKEYSFLDSDKNINKLNDSQYDIKVYTFFSGEGFSSLNYPHHVYIDDADVKYFEIGQHINFIVPAGSNFKITGIGDCEYMISFEVQDFETIPFENNLVNGEVFKGLDGKSAYGTWKDLGNVGTEQDFINSLMGFCLGVGQTWKDFTSSRLLNEIYTNTTGRSIEVKVTGNAGAGSGVDVEFYVDDFVVEKINVDGANGTVGAIIPSGSTYYCSISTIFNAMIWKELR